MTKPYLAAAVLVLGGLMISTPALADYGAIAFSQKTGNYGYSYGFNSRSGAEARAMAGCGSRKSGCGIVLWFTKACGSLAVGSKRGYGTGWGASRAQARSIAMGICRSNDRNCREVVWSCSG